jgi:hypothetical protein
VGGVRTAAALTAASRRARKAAARPTHGTEWRIVDSAHAAQWRERAQAPTIRATLVCRTVVGLVAMVPAIVTRYEDHVENFLGMVRLGCRRIVLRYS